MAHSVKDSILREFSRNPEGQLCIQFSDPEYVRSDIIIFDSKDLSLHAVLHGAAHFVGHAGRELGASLRHNDEVILAAPHYFSGEVHLPAKISVI